MQYDPSLDDWTLGKLFLWWMGLFAAMALYVVAC